MRSIRWSLLVYFLVVLALAMGVVSLLVYQQMEATVHDKERADSDLLASIEDYLDGEWVVAFSSGVGQNNVGETRAMPMHGGATRRLCTGGCRAMWSAGVPLRLSAQAPRARPPAPPAGRSELAACSAMPIW